MVPFYAQWSLQYKPAERMREHLLRTPMTHVDETNHVILRPYVPKKKKFQINLTSMKIHPKEYYFLRADYQQIDYSLLQP